MFPFGLTHLTCQLLVCIDIRLLFEFHAMPSAASSFQERSNRHGCRVHFPLGLVRHSNWWAKTQALKPSISTCPKLQLGQELKNNQEPADRASRAKKYDAESIDE